MCVCVVCFRFNGINGNVTKKKKENKTGNGDNEHKNGVNLKMIVKWFKWKLASSILLRINSK